MNRFHPGANDSITQRDLLTVDPPDYLYKDEEVNAKISHFWTHSFIHFTKILRRFYLSDPKQMCPTSYPRCTYIKWKPVQNHTLFNVYARTATVQKLKTNNQTSMMDSIKIVNYPQQGKLVNLPSIIQNHITQSTHPSVQMGGLPYDISGTGALLFLLSTTAPSPFGNSFKLYTGI